MQLYVNCKLIKLSKVENSHINIQDTQDLSSS